ncbi:intein/intein [Streptomyces sp. 840.1]|uniref:polymorphic toxin-type HINT domain-containing protein n=1 Tax=Streptomyces sp. 840.1 TaxID=2485152 RepID=UPI000F47382D|nr:polymorphic toxin-type HINT domain-containing protein [Streptomyces sp. 840.1]ROQ66060.1 intein/intein [Streptomyces sp. 840.1]
MTDPKPTSGQQPPPRGSAADEPSTLPSPDDTPPCPDRSLPPGTPWKTRLQILTGSRSALLFGIAGAVVVAMVAGLLTLTSSSADSDAAQTTQRNLKPFREAVDDLAKAPGLRYKDTSASGTTQNEISVTANGSQFGTASSGRNAPVRDVLRIGGKAFTREHVAPAPGQDPTAGGKTQPSEWAAGMDDGSKLLDKTLARAIAPSGLAAVLTKALTGLEKSPASADGARASSPYGQQPLSVNGTPALGVDTSAGRLLVTKNKPHRVLRLEAHDPRESISAQGEQAPNGETPTAPPTVTTGPLVSGDAEGMEVIPVLADAADKMFDTLVEYAGQLKDATDRGIAFSLDGAGEMNCTSSGCTTTQSFTGVVTSTARKERVTKGEVTATMNANFTIDGKPAGQCTSAQRTFPVRGNTVSGTLKCSDPGAGPLYASVAARVQAQAKADAQTCGCQVRLTYPLRAKTLINARALAEVEAQKLADQAKSERDLAACAKPHSFPSGTQVLLANGATRAIEDIRIGDRVVASEPRTGLTAARPVTNTFTTEDDENFTRLTITTEQGPATVTATDNHPFWLEDDQRWKNAGALRIGDELRTPDGVSVPVTEVRNQQGPQRTHDLTVKGLHTYYVLAGQTPVLVHNSNCPLTGGFKAGVSPDEIADINRGFGGETLLSGSPANTLANASRYNSFWDKSAVVIRDIAGSHMFNNGNKRTAQATVEQLMQRNGVTSGPTSADLRSVIDRVGKGQLHDVSDISAALRGY